jgi:hypothetical protein
MRFQNHLKDATGGVVSGLMGVPGGALATLAGVGVAASLAGAGGGKKKRSEKNKDKKKLDDEDDEERSDTESE